MALESHSLRIVVVGATGNVGSAVLKRLHSAPDVGSIVGVARRRPDSSQPPYAGVEWEQVDIGSALSLAKLVDVFDGADAVVHAGWALQPNHDEAAMRATNVDGTARVLEAAAAASVGQVVVMSSVGAYSVGPKRRRVDESWPTGGIATSHYARHKAANERALDAFEEEHPEILVTRMRPGLIFQRDAGLEVAGLFLGRRFPTRWLSVIRPPILPFPSGAIFQAVHTDDVADAIWRTIDRGASGPFNIAAEPVLDPQLIATTIGARRTVPFRAGAARALVGLTWRLRLQATDPGWIDIAISVPIMSTARARTELGWIPKVTSTEALAEIVDGVAKRTRVKASGPLGG
jgi:UDP-glucose 4-epimerase